MKTQQAIETARRLVELDYYGRQQYRVRHYDETRRAWYEGNITNRETALRDLCEIRIEKALQSAGIEDAGAVAYATTYNHYPADWRSLVRDIIRRKAEGALA